MFQQKLSDLIEERIVEHLEDLKQELTNHAVEEFKAKLKPELDSVVKRMEIIMKRSELAHSVEFNLTAIIVKEEDK